ncbi:MAG TPA: hypothetical protein VM123_16290 [archaeon]|nr:hypothetical protein [archaeon]
MYPSPYIRFKSTRQEREWFEGTRGDSGRDLLHPALYVLVLAAAHWHYLRVGQPAVVTHILRTGNEQRSIYPGSPDRRSPHEFGRGADLRTRDLAPEMAGEWEAWINNTFPYHGKEGALTALLHQIGNRGQHLHLQVGPLEAHPPVIETFIQSTLT